MMDTAVLTKSFRITIPKPICDAQDWQPGQPFAFLPKGTGVVIVPVPKRGELAGILKGATTGRYRDRKDRF